MDRQTRRRITKLVHEGDYLAGVDVEQIISGEGCSPYLSLEDANRLDDVRQALRDGDVRAAACYGRVYSLTPVAL